MKILRETSQNMPDVFCNLPRNEMRQLCTILYNDGELDSCEGCSLIHNVLSKNNIDIIYVVHSLSFLTMKRKSCSIKVNRPYTFYQLHSGTQACNHALKPSLIFVPRRNSYPTLSNPFYQTFFPVVYNAQIHS